MTNTSRIAIVTGAGSGIGRATARDLARANVTVVCLDQTKSAAEETVSLIVDESGRAEAAVADLADLEACRAVVERCVKEHGRLDILVNNAAVGGGGLFADVSESTFDRLFAVNVRGTFFLTQAAVTEMKRNSFGRVINVASLIAARGTAGNPHYSGAKAALFGFMRCWATELAPFGITVNTVVPALTPTPMATAVMSQSELEDRARTIPAGRLGQPEDVSKLITFLVSDAASFITGQAISPNGAEFVGAL